MYTQEKGQRRTRKACVIFTSSFTRELRKTILHSPIIHSIVLTIFATERLENIRFISKSVDGKAACEGGDIPKKRDIVSGPSGWFAFR